MAMGKRTHEEQASMWVAVKELPRSVSHRFYEKLNRLLAEHGFDDFVETQCRPFYAEKMGRPSLAPGQYFRLLLLGYFEGLDSERAIAWGAADSLGVRAFLGLALTEAAPDHSTISRTRRLIDLDTHRTVFTWVLRVLPVSLHDSILAVLISFGCRCNKAPGGDSRCDQKSQP
jgi:transposase